MKQKYRKALIVGAGSGLSASLAHLFAANGLTVSLAARSTEKLAPLCRDTGAHVYECDSASTKQVNALFSQIEQDGQTPDLAIYNPSYRTRGRFIDLDPAEVKKAIDITAYGGFLVAQQAAKRMLPNNSGCIVFTGASAAVKGYAQSAPFAMGKFALRGLAQSMARELHPQGIHIGHVVIDGGIRNPNRPERVEASDAPDSMLDPDAIAKAYWDLITQDRSVWSWEIEVRPWVERF